MIYNLSARGIIEKNGKILFIEYTNSKEILYALPGGGQNVGEDLRSTLKREFKEETGLDIESQEVIIVREFIIESSHFEPWKNGIHQVEVIFRCTQLIPEQNACPGEHQDIGMLGLKWLGKDEMEGLKVYPANNLFEILDGNGITYIFDRD